MPPESGAVVPDPRQLSIDRRGAFRVAGVAAAGLTAAACGASTPKGSPTSPTPTGSPTASGGGGTAIERSSVVRAVADASARPAGVAGIQGFTADLYRKLSVVPGNLVCSPYSVAVALAMARNGARGRTATEMDRVLHASTAGSLNDGLNALTQLIDSRSGPRRNSTGTKTAVTLDVANSLWGQRGELWEPAFLDTLARDYGAGMQTVDYESAPESARTAINSWTSAKTHARIPHLIPAGALDRLTRLVLVNAIYLKAPWSTAFTQAKTAPATFTPAGGARVQVPMMNLDTQPLGYAAGAGWQAVDLPYAGNELAMALVLPDAGRLPAMEAALDGPAVAKILTGFRSAPVQLSMPKWTARSSLSLRDALSALGMPTALEPGKANFSGMTTQDALYISAALHQGWIAVDEQGTEAAAATAVVMEALAGRAADETHTVVLDRPFLYVIHDVASGTPLFVGRVADPSVAAAGAGA